MRLNQAWHPHTQTVKEGGIVSSYTIQTISLLLLVFVTWHTYTNDRLLLDSSIVRGLPTV